MSEVFTCALVWLETSKQLVQVIRISTSLNSSFFLCSPMMRVPELFVGGHSFSVVLYMPLYILHLITMLIIIMDNYVMTCIDKKMENRI